MAESNTKKKDRKKDRHKREEVGHVIVCGKRSYRIESLLGSGDFGDVYKVHWTTDVEKKYAMKTERYDLTNETNRRLVVETGVFDAIQGDERDIDKTHFARMLKAGRTPEYWFIVMELVGPSLYDIRRRMMKGHMSPRTIAEIARQTLRAVESLHELGWLHLDLKPHNFAIGLPPKDSTIFMLEFGIARSYTDKEGDIRAPRAKRHWMGTRRYATVSALFDEEQCRKDDIGSWCYIILEFYWQNNLVWSVKKFPKDMELKIREFVFAEPLDMLAKNQLRIPKRFVEILSMTHALTFTAKPDYARMQAVLEEIVKDEKIDMSAPLDWIGKEMPEDPERIQLSDRREEPELDREQQKALAARRKRLEKEIQELYELGGEQLTIQEVREEIRRKHRRRRKRTEEEEEDDSYRSEDDYSEDDRRRRRGRKRRDRSPHGRRTSPEDSEGRRRRREPSRGETRDGAMEVGRDNKEQARKKTPEKSDDKDKPKEKKDGKRGGTKEEQVDNEGGKKKKEQDRKNILEKPAEKEKAGDKEKEGKKEGIKEGKPEDGKAKKGEAVAERLPLHKEMKKGREATKDEKKKPTNGKVEKPGGKSTDSKETPSPAMTPSPTANKAGKANGKSTDSKETPSPVMTPSPTAKKGADVVKKGAVDKKK